MAFRKAIFEPDFINFSTETGAKALIVNDYNIFNQINILQKARAVTYFADLK